MVPPRRGRHRERGDPASQETRAVEAIAVDVGTDPGDASGRRPLPVRPAVATPIGGGDRRRRDAPMGDPERVAVIGEPCGVPEVRAPEVRARVDHGAHAGPAVHASQPRTHPVRQLGNGEAVVLLDVQRGQDVTGGVLGNVEEVVGLGFRIARSDADLRPMVGADDQPVRGRPGQILRVPGVVVGVPARRPHDHEARLRRADRAPVHVPLPHGDVDPRHLRPRGHRRGGRDDREDRGDQCCRADTASARAAPTRRRAASNHPRCRHGTTLTGGWDGPGITLAGCWPRKKRSSSR